MRCVIYSRYSSTKQDKSFTIEEQNLACSQKANSEGAEVVEIFEDKAQSAKTLNRPSLTSLIEYVSDPKNNISVIYCYDISRFSRNQLDFLLLKKELSEHGVSLRSVQGVSGDSLEGSLIQDILSRVSQFKNEIDSVKIKSGMHGRFKAGYALRPVRGYKWGKDATGRSIIVPDDTFDIYKSLWLKIAAEKLTLPQALGYINKQLPLNKKLTRSSLSRLLQNKIYMGVLSYPMYEEEIAGNHIPMIKEDIYWAVRGIIEGRKTSRAFRRFTNPLYPLTKLLLCPKCDKPMTAALSKGKLKSYAYYFCRNRKVCKQNIPVKTVHEAFKTLLKSLELTPEMSQYLKEFIQEKYEATYNNLTQSARFVQADISDLLKKQEELLKMRMENEITKEEYSTYKTKINAQLIAKRVLLSDKQLDQIDIEVILNFITHYMQNVSKMWEQADIEGKLALQSSTFPDGVYFSENTCRTPSLGFAFAFAKQFQTLSDPCGSRTPNSRPLWLEYMKRLWGLEWILKRLNKRRCYNFSIMENNKQIVIHLMGPMGSGKGTAGEFLHDKFNFQVFKLSQVVKNEVEKENLPATRECMNLTYDKLRQEQGLDIVAKKVLSLVPPHTSRIVFDGARNVAEVKAIRYSFPDVISLYIDADAKQREKRVESRQRSIDKGDINALLQKDLEYVLPCKNVEGVIVMENNSTLKSFYSTLVNYLQI